VSENLAAAKRAPAAEGVAEALAPGEPEVRTRAQRERDGIALPEANWQDLAHVAARFDVALPECHRM
jgi:LDH2 family malate/lactate/ureidoglycolate dehydrogenase